MSRQRSGLATLSHSLGAALQWRVLLWWLLALSVPTLIAVLPVWAGLDAAFSNTTATPAILEGNVAFLAEGMFAVGQNTGAIRASTIIALLLSIALSPWLSGMVVASIRARRRLGLGELLQGGFVEYGRMLRLMLLAFVLLGVAFAIGAAVMHSLEGGTDKAVLASDVERAKQIGFAVIAVLLVFAHMTVEAARGWVAAVPQQRSVLRAWGNGLMLVLRRPLTSLMVYIGIAIVAYGLALIFGWLRLRTGTTTSGGFIAALLLTQVIVALFAYARVSRLYAFADLASARIARRGT